MDHFDRDQLVLQLIVTTVLMLFVMFLMLEDIERLKRVTMPRLVFVADPTAAHEKRAGEPAPIEEADELTLN